MWKNHISSRNTTGLPRPPPGLTNPKPSSPWNSTAPRSVRGWGAQDSRLASGEKNHLIAPLIRPEECTFYSTNGLEERKLQLPGKRKKSSFLKWKFHVSDWDGVGRILGPAAGDEWRWSQSCQEGIPIARGLSRLEGIG